MTNENNVYEGTPDTRQSDDVDHPVSRFRPRYRALKPDELQTHNRLKDAYAGIELQFAEVPDGRYKALALTALEESCMWIVKALTS